MPSDHDFQRIEKDLETLKEWNGDFTELEWSLLELRKAWREIVAANRIIEGVAHIVKDHETHGPGCFVNESVEWARSHGAAAGSSPSDEKGCAE